MARGSGGSCGSRGSSYEVDELMRMWGTSSIHEEEEEEAHRGGRVWAKDD